jgi:hypothetical protein
VRILERDRKQIPEQIGIELLARTTEINRRVRTAELSRGSLPRG